MLVVAASAIDPFRDVLMYLLYPLKNYVLHRHVVNYSIYAPSIHLI